MYIKQDGTVSTHINSADSLNNPEVVELYKKLLSGLQSLSGAPRMIPPENVGILPVEVTADGFNGSIRFNTIN